MIIHPNAKINLGLNIVEKRPDGYHNLETIFYPIPLKDTIEITPSDSSCDYTLISEGITIAGDQEDNLVVKALKNLKKDHAIPLFLLNLALNLLGQLPIKIIRYAFVRQNLRHDFAHLRNRRFHYDHICRVFL